MLSSRCCLARSSSSFVTQIGRRRKRPLPSFRPSSSSFSSSSFPSSSSSTSSSHHHGHEDQDDDVRLIACVAPPHLAIGKAGQLPWDLPEDRRYFFHCTRGHVLVLGRQSYEEAGHALPDRDTVVVSRTLSSLPDAHLASSLAEALVLTREIKRKKKGENMITWIGGGHDLYQQTMAEHKPSLLYLTQTYFQVQDGDAFFPRTWAQSFPRQLWSYKSLGSPCTFGIYAAAASRK